MKKSEGLHWKSFIMAVWGVLGASQLMIATGCGQNAVAGSAAAVQGQKLTQNAKPVRISRGFFEASLSGEVQAQASNGHSSRVSQGLVQWQEFPTTQAPPSPTEETGPVLADFRDHTGCASFIGEAEGVQLCFKIMGDVSNIGLNEREMSVNGLSTWLDRQLGIDCPRSARDAWQITFQAATREPKGFVVSYVAIPPAGDACRTTGPVPVSVRVVQSEE